MDVRNEREIIKNKKYILLCECFLKMAENEINFYIKINEIFA